MDDSTETHCAEIIPLNIFSLVSVSDNDILNVINDTKPDSAPSDDGIYVRHIMETHCFLVKPLKLLFKQTLNTSKVPEDWKIRLTVSIYKKNGKPESPSSCRSKCLTSIA